MVVISEVIKWKAHTHTQEEHGMKFEHFRLSMQRQSKPTNGKPKHQRNFNQNMHGCFMRVFVLVLFVKEIV